MKEALKDLVTLLKSIVQSEQEVTSEQHYTLDSLTKNERNLLGYLYLSVQSKLTFLRYLQQEKNLIIYSNIYLSSLNSYKISPNIQEEHLEGFRAMIKGGVEKYEQLEHYLVYVDQTCHHPRLALHAFYFFLEIAKVEDQKMALSYKKAITKEKRRRNSKTPVLFALQQAEKSPLAQLFDESHTLEAMLNKFNKITLNKHFIDSMKYSLSLYEQKSTIIFFENVFTIYRDSRTLIQRYLKIQNSENRLAIDVETSQIFVNIGHLMQFIVNTNAILKAIKNPDEQAKIIHFPWRYDYARYKLSVIKQHADTIKTILKHANDILDEKQPVDSSTPGTTTIANTLKSLPVSPVPNKGKEEVSGESSYVVEKKQEETEEKVGVGEWGISLEEITAIIEQQRILSRQKKSNSPESIVTNNTVEQKTPASFNIAEHIQKTLKPFQQNILLKIFSIDAKLDLNEAAALITALGGYIKHSGKTSGSGGLKIVLPNFNPNQAHIIADTAQTHIIPDTATVTGGIHKPHKKGHNDEVLSRGIIEYLRYLLGKAGISREVIDALQKPVNSRVTP